MPLKRKKKVIAPKKPAAIAKKGKDKAAPASVAKQDEEDGSIPENDEGLELINTNLNESDLLDDIDIKTDRPTNSTELIKQILLNARNKVAGFGDIKVIFKQFIISFYLFKIIYNYLFINYYIAEAKGYTYKG